MKDEYIRKQDAIKAACRGFCHPGALCPDELPCREQTKYLRELPPADVVQVVHGRWIKYTGMGKVQWMCSECSAEEKNPKVARYCYHCGAKMDGERKE